jgi:hypothetical protein
MAPSGYVSDRQRRLFATCYIEAALHSLTSTRSSVVQPATAS